MLDAEQLRKVALNVKLCFVKVAKCKQSGILTYIQIKAKYSSIVWQMGNFSCRK
jgi:hypothetical protein